MNVSKGQVQKRKKLLIYLASIIIVIKLFSINSQWVEDIYSTKTYKAISYFLRAIFGWLPFSIGDIIYLTASIWLIWKLIRFIKVLFKRQVTSKWLQKAGYKILLSAMIIYIIFNFFWGINYDRKTIAMQMDLPEPYVDTASLKDIQLLLLQKVNESKQALIDQHAAYPTNKQLFARALDCYRQAKNIYPFLKYYPVSVKSSLFGRLGNYFGFTGYYNPFSGEAQVNTTVPKFITPYTTCHEIAHQLGYAKEEEANFVGYLAATSSTDTLFHYSTYLDLFLYSNRALFFVDSLSAKTIATRLSPPVKTDIKELREFLRRNQNPMEPIIRWAYGKYLRANHQPKGINSYDDVIADLIAYYKKYGKI